MSEPIKPGVRQSALLLLALGTDEAAEVMKHLSVSEVRKLSEAMAALQSIEQEHLEEVIEKFCALTMDGSAIQMDMDEYLRTVLKKALGDDRASLLIKRILGEQTHHGQGIENLKWMEPKAVAQLIKDEHPQIIATVLVHLESDQLAKVVLELPEKLRNDVLLRILTLDGVQPSALQELNQVLMQLLSDPRATDKTILGGVQTTAGILNQFPSDIEQSVIENFKTFDADLAQKVIDEMFIFDQLLQIEDRGIQIILREVQSDSLIVALKGASQELQDKILKNMSQRAAEMLREDMEMKGPVRLSEVEAQQKQILELVRRLASEGQVVISRGGDDAYV